MPSKVRKEVKYRHLDNAGLCKMGVKVGFKDSLGCELRRRKRERGDDKNMVKRGPRGIRIRVRIRIRIRININVKKQR